MNVRISILIWFFIITISRCLKSSIMMGAGEGRTLLAGRSQSQPTVAKKEWDVFAGQKTRKRKVWDLFKKNG